MNLTVDSLIDKNNIITGSNKITLRKFKPNGSDKIYRDKDLIADKLYQLIHQVNNRKINQKEIYFILLDNILSFSDGNGKTCKMLFVSNFK